MSLSKHESTFPFMSWFILTIGLSNFMVLIVQYYLWEDKIEMLDQRWVRGNVSSGCQALRRQILCECENFQKALQVSNVFIYM